MPVVRMSAHNINDGLATKHAACETWNVYVPTLILRPTNLRAGVLRNVRILAGARETSPLELSRHIINNLVMMMRSFSVHTC
jgi:hypothetical protein